MSYVGKGQVTVFCCSFVLILGFLSSLVTRSCVYSLFRVCVRSFIVHSFVRSSVPFVFLCE